MSKGLRLDPTNPEHRKLLEKSEGGKKGLREYFSGNKSAQKILRDHHNNKNLNPESSSHNNHRIDITKMMEKTESSNKYGNKICYDEIFKTKQKFDSLWERTCWYKLKNLENEKIITDLETQVKIRLDVNDHHICDFIIDFRFKYKGNYIYADAKSKATMPAGARYKVNLFRALHEDMLFLLYSHKSSIIEELEEEIKNGNNL